VSGGSEHRRVQGIVDNNIGHGLEDEKHEEDLKEKL
jgi:hypothetical protein